MEFTKIQVTKQGTLNVTYKNEDGDIIDFKGANIVHKDLKATMNALIPHIALLTEQREAYNRKLKELEADRIQDGNSRSVFRLMTVDTITLSEEEKTVSLAGCRILQNGMVIKVESPQLNSADVERYDYCSELFLAVEAAIYEAKAYWNEQKWGIKEGDLDFAADDPFDGKVTADQVPQADIEPAEKKPKKAKKVKVA